MAATKPSTQTDLIEPTAKPKTSGARKAAQITASVTEVVPIEQLKLHPMNARAGNVARVVESLMYHGQSRPLVANKRTMHVLAGNHTLMALRELGVKEVLVSWVDVDEKTEKKFLLVENKTNDPEGNHSKYHIDKLELLLQEVSLEGTGWSDVEKADVVEQMEMTRADGGKKLRVDFHGGYAETEEEFQKRTATTPGVQLRELVLLFQEPERVKALALIEQLNKHWKLKGGNPAVILKALTVCAHMWEGTEKGTDPLGDQEEPAAVATPAEPEEDLGQLERQVGMLSAEQQRALLEGQVEHALD